ncbi:phage tail length tape measure family protein [Salipiger pacificus]|nr:phage tail length tape measure family protein [Alloyangia pacifica]
MADQNNVTATVRIDVIGSPELQRLQTTVNQTQTSLRNFNRQAANVNKSLPVHAINNVANQLGDMVVQVTSGQNAFRALSQQLPQMLVGFSGIGVAIATVGTALIGVIPMLLNTATEAERFGKAMEDSKTAIDEIRNATDNALRPFSEFRKEFGKFADQAAALAGISLDKEIFELQRTADNLSKSISDSNTVDEVKGLIDSIKVLTQNEAAYNRQRELGLQVSGLIENNNRQLIRQQDTLARHTGLTAEQAAEFLRISEGISAMMARGEVSGEWAAAAQSLRESVEETGNMRTEIDEALSRVIDLSVRWLEVKDASQDAESAAEGVANETGRAANAASTLAANYQVALSAIRAVQGVAAGIAADTVRLQAQTKNLLAGGDLISSETAGRLAAEQERLQEALNSDNYNIAAGARAELAKLEEQLYDNEAARRSNAAAVDAWRESVKTSTETLTGGGGGGGGAAGALQTTKERLEEFKESLHGYRTPAREAELAQAELQKQFKEFEGSLNPEELELYKTAMRQLAEDAKEVANELGAIGQIFDSSMSSMFDSVIDQTASVKDAFNNMLDSILKDIAKFMLNAAVSQFLTSLSGLSGFGFLGQSGGIFAGTSGFPTNFAGPSPAPPAPAPAFTPAHWSRGASTTPTFGGSGAGGMGGANGSDINVSIYNENGSQVQVAQGSNRVTGEKELQVYIRSEVLSAISDGELDRQMRLNYGIRRKG